MLLFSPRKAQFYTNDLIDLREMVNGSFFNGSFKKARSIPPSQNRKGVFLEYCTGNLYRLLLKHFLSEMHH